MEQSTLDGLTQRLELLERENRRMKRLGSLALAGLSLVALIGATSTGGRTVDAQHFVVKNAEGKVVAELGLRPDGMPKLELIGTGGKSRVVLSPLPEGAAALAISSSDGKSLAVSTIGNGAMGLTLFDKNSHPRVELSVQPDGTPRLALLDKDQRVTWQAP